MDDGLKMIYDILKDDDVIRKYTESDQDGLRIKYYEYPETADMQGVWIALESIINALPSSLADETWVTYDYLMHIEVWSRERNDTLTVSDRIRDLLWKQLKFKQNDSTEEFDLGIYRDARRYKGTLHRSDLDII